MPNLFENVYNHIRTSRDYHTFFKRYPNLIKPKRWTEKIQRLKISKEYEKYSTYTDKYEVRSFIKISIGEKYLTKLYGIYDDFSQIDFASFPNKFALKSTHSSGWNLICKDKNKLDLKDAQAKISKWLSSNYYHVWREIQYKNIKPRIICEEYLDDHGQEPMDYKFFCFSGKPQFLQVDIDRFSKHKRNVYDMSWQVQPFSLTYPNSSIVIKKPKNFETMVSIAQKLSKNFKHVRVDLYNINGKIYFSELTLTHGSGFSRCIPDEYDFIIGDYLEI